MLPGMSRFVLLALLIACDNGSKSPGEQPKSAGNTGATEEKIAVPGAKEGGPTEGAVDGSAATGAVAPDDPTKLSNATRDRAKNPAYNLKAEEGTLSVAKAQAKAGAAATAEIKLAPASGYHVATDFPIKL